MRMRLTDTRARLAAEIERLGLIYVITDQSEPERCRHQFTKYRVYLTVEPHHREGGEDQIPVLPDDARMALEAFRVLAASSPSGMSPAMTAAAARISAHLPETTNLPAL